MTDYKLMAAQLEALIEGVEWEISNLSNAAALIWDSALLSLALYLVMPAICIGASVIVARLLERYVPRIFSVLVGGRT